MRFLQHLGSIPLTIRVPALVATLMIIISVILSERVLTRLYETQEQNLRSVVATYLDGLSTALIPAVLRDDIWDAYDVLDRTRSIYGAVAPIETVVTGRDGRVLASSNPKLVAPLSELPEDYAEWSESDGRVQVDWTSQTGFGKRSLLYQGKTIGAIHSSFNISHLAAERREVLNTLLATNAALALSFAAVGYLLAKRMVQPVKTLADHMRSGAAGTPQTIAIDEFPQREGEFANLFHGFNALVEAERERGALTMRLAEEEKLASLGRLASGMAHEINNPLGGLFNSIDTLRRHGSDPMVRDNTLSLLERGLTGIRDVVRAALATYRPERHGRAFSLQDLDDVCLLVGPEASRRRQSLDWSRSSDLPPQCSLSGAAVRQAMLNLVLNASAAAGEGGRVTVSSRLENDDDTLVLSVGDTGPGLSETARHILTAPDPGPASRAGGGLGLWMVRQMVEDTQGNVQIRSDAASGTLIELHLPLGGKEDVNHAA